VIVVDASVAAKWFLAEEDTPAANALPHGTQKLVAPALIRVEVYAAITRRFRKGEAPEAEVRQGCRDWSEMIDDGLITLLPSEPD
jgi:predicted nucleic acid-binding protein